MLEFVDTRGDPFALLPSHSESKPFDLDLGSNHKLTFIAWRPDRVALPQYADIPDIERYGALLTHTTPSGLCHGMLVFDSPLQRRIDPQAHTWVVLDWSPLTLHPSIHCSTCPDHGYIRNGRWEKA